YAGGTRCGRTSRSASKRRRANTARMIRVAVDGLGGDRAPDEVVAGAAEVASGAIQPIVFGPAGLDTHGLTHVETSEAIAMDDHPVESVRSKTDSSLVRAVR